MEEHNLSVAENWESRGLKHNDKCITGHIPMALRYVGKEVTLDCETESKLMQSPQKIFTRGIW